MGSPKKIALAYSIGIGHASVRHAHLIGSAYDSDLLGHLGSTLSKEYVSTCDNVGMVCSFVLLPGIKNEGYMKDPYGLAWD